MATGTRPSSRHKRLNKEEPSWFGVEFFDCATRFLVVSESRPDEVHLVDLNSDDGGRYECSCEDWMFRNPEWTVAPIPYECKHITQAKTFVFRLAEHMKKVEKAPDFEDL